VSQNQSERVADVLDFVHDAIIESNEVTEVRVDPESETMVVVMDDENEYLVSIEALT
jgi:hypothetical protein